ncbi:hypothetical protein GCM10020295_79830 [Streptomyces cinereospinus]
MPGRSAALGASESCPRAALIRSTGWRPTPPGRLSDPSGPLTFTTGTPPEAACAVTYHRDTSRGDGFVATVTVRNRSGAPMCPRRTAAAETSPPSAAPEPPLPARTRHRHAEVGEPAATGVPRNAVGRPLRLPSRLSAGLTRASASAADHRPRLSSGRLRAGRGLRRALPQHEPVRHHEVLR